MYDLARRSGRYVHSRSNERKRCRGFVGGDTISTSMSNHRRCTVADFPVRPVGKVIQPDSALARTTQLPALCKGFEARTVVQSSPECFPSNSICFRRSRVPQLHRSVLNYNSICRKCPRKLGLLEFGGPPANQKIFPFSNFPQPRLVRVPPPLSDASRLNTRGLR